MPHRWRRATTAAEKVRGELEGRSRAEEAMAERMASLEKASAMARETAMREAAAMAAEARAAEATAAAEREAAAREVEAKIRGELAATRDDLARARAAAELD